MHFKEARTQAEKRSPIRSPHPLPPSAPSRNLFKCPAEVITANKKAGSGGLQRYDECRDAQRSAAQWSYAGFVPASKGGRESGQKYEEELENKQQHVRKTAH